VISRYLARCAVATLTATLVLSLAGRAGLSAAQQPPPSAPQGAPPPQGPPGGPGGRGGFQLRNVQVLKDVPADQFQLVMQYVAASLGVQCNYCHVMNDNASDDKETKKTARKMMQMVSDLNTQFFGGTSKVSCASCHNGHPKPSKTGGEGAAAPLAHLAPAPRVRALRVRAPRPAALPARAPLVDRGVEARVDLRRRHR
jgi:hypothetical protein